MSVVYSADLKTTRMQAVINRVDIGTAGSLEICSAGYAAVLARIVLNKPSFSVSGDTLTLLGVPILDSSADNTGTGAVARIKDGSSNVIVNSLTVGVGSGDIQLNSVQITQGQAVTITRGTIQHG